LEGDCKEKSKASIKSHSGEEEDQRKTRINNKEERNNGREVGWTGR